MVRTSIVGALLAVLAVAGLLGCSDGGSSEDGSLLDDCWIEASCFYYDMDAPWGPRCLCEVAVGYVDPEGGDGYWPDDLIVEVNGSQLLFAPSLMTYLLVQGPEFIPEGDTAVLSVSDGEKTVVATVDMPFAPGSLVLVGGTWDVSSLYSSNNLQWQNELITGNELAVRVWGPTEPDGTLLGSFILPGSGIGEGAVLYNWQLTDYTSLDETVICEVFQVNHVIIEEQRHDSNLRAYAGVWGEWPVAARGAAPSEALTGQPN
jgi:hypothetical protein